MLTGNIKQKQIESRWIKIVTIFLYVTVIWNCIEGGTSIYFGYNTNDISLFAFGIDSLIEVLSASLVLYHMIFKSLPSAFSTTSTSETTSLTNKSVNKSTLFTLETERKLTLFIGCLLVIFCLFACVGGVFRLIEGVPPANTTFGIIIGGICIIAMFIMWYYKTKASVILNSSTLASDAACSLGCIKLSTVLCIGSILYEIWPVLWWVDAATAIVIGLLVGYEGCQTIQGAKDREKFKGGCGCCGATDSGLAKYFREKFEKEIGTKTPENVNIKEADDCCGGCGDDESEEIIDIDNYQQDDCCGSGPCSDNKVSNNNYGSINNKINSNVLSGCNDGCC